MFYNTPHQYLLKNIVIYFFVFILFTFFFLLMLLNNQYRREVNHRSIRNKGMVQWW